MRAGLLLKQRVMRKDLGPLDTWRASVLAGADLPGKEGVRESTHVSPRLGVATTAILGRHGLNGQVDWTGRIGEDELCASSSANRFGDSCVGFLADLLVESLACLVVREHPAPPGGAARCVKLTHLPSVPL